MKSARIATAGGGGRFWNIYLGEKNFQKEELIYKYQKKLWKNSAKNYQIGLLVAKRLK